MSKGKQSWILMNIVSPYGLAVFSYSVFIISCLIPPRSYSHYMGEPDLMFLDPKTIVFYTLCVACFIAGVWLIGWLFPSSFHTTKINTKISPFLFLVLPLLTGIGATLASIALLIGHNPTIVLLLLAQRGADVKNTVSFETTGNFTLAPLLLIGVIWWSYWRYEDLRLFGWKKRWAKVAIFLAIASVIASSTLLLSRDRLMLIVSGMAILYLLRKTKLKQVTVSFLLRAGSLIALGICSLFFAFSFLRGSASWDDQVYLLFGYTIASYNRLAAIVNGILRSPLIDRGVYLSGFFAFSRFIPLNALMNWRNHDDIFNAAFGAVSGVGLDGRLVWSGAFGAIFLDLGWYTCLFLLGYGLIYGVVWNWFKRGKTLGIVIYPCCGFCVLFWFGSNYLLDTQAVFIVVIAIILAVYELIFTRRRPAVISAE